MKSKLTKEFRKRYARLPRNVQEQARAAYALFKENPYHESLHFKCIDSQESIYSARVGRRYRVLGIWRDDTIYWFFIGSHEEYNHLV